MIAAKTCLRLARDQRHLHSYKINCFRPLPTLLLTLVHSVPAEILSHTFRKPPPTPHARLTCANGHTLFTSENVSNHRYIHTRCPWFSHGVSATPNYD